MSKHKKKQFCLRGHNTFITGRDKNNSCIQCRKDRYIATYVPIPRKRKYKPRSNICPQGHNKDIVGHYKDNSCSQCRLERGRIDPTKNSKIKSICKNGHDISIVGRDETGWCNICKIEYKKNWQKLHKEELKIKQRKYYEEHREKINKALVEKRLTDVEFKLKYYLRTRLRCAIKGNYKSGSAVKDLGCPIEFLKDYIAAQFYDDMTWDNWGPVWELDHIKELHTFDLTDREQFLKANNYTNLQPLTILEHDKKSAQNRRR